MANNTFADEKDIHNKRKIYGFVCFSINVILICLRREKI